MRNFHDASGGVCMMFAYRLLRKSSQIEVAVQPKNMKKEVLWKVENSKGAELWKCGQVFLGFSSEFRVREF